MDEKLERKQLRRVFGKMGWTLLGYYGIMLVSVFTVVMAESFYAALVYELGGAAPDMNEIVNNAWGYFIAAGIGLLILLLWKGRKYLFCDLWEANKPMETRTFFEILCVFMCSQLGFQLIAMVIETILNLLGFSAMAAIESASMNADTWSMFLYAGILAPITEEILFRGLVLRTLQPYGKKFAILTSAVFFGIFHGNIVQSPFAFAVGLVLGYVAVEYSISWAILLHMINNLIFGDTLPRLIGALIPGWSDAIGGILTYALSIAGFVILLVRRRKVGNYLRQERLERNSCRAFFTAFGNIVLFIVMLINMIAGITRI